jgi:hypothetical protein
LKVGEVPAQPVQLGDGERVFGAGVAGQLAEAVALQRLEDVAGSPKIRTLSSSSVSPASASRWVCRWVLCSSVETRE